MPSIPRGFDKEHAHLLRNSDRLLHLLSVHSQRLLAEHMLARLHRPNRSRNVKLIRQRDIYPINLWIGKELVII